ncbi:hypothetical protein N9C86_00805 [Schleiferiaceae bacterium]|nr:hypothetical protein [Schleiferiaceae bacterium]
MIWYNEEVGYTIKRFDGVIDVLRKSISLKGAHVVCGHSRLITNGLGDNQPVVRGDIAVIHNGIIVNYEELFVKHNLNQELAIDTEIIAALTEKYLNEHNGDCTSLADFILSECQGTVSVAIILIASGKLILASNNGSLYVGNKGETRYFASEKYALSLIHCADIKQINSESKAIISIPKANTFSSISEIKRDRNNFLPEVVNIIHEESKLLHYNADLNIKRCTKCVLPETMPFISFDEKGECNYCKNYKLRNVPKPKKELFDLVSDYRRPGKDLDAIVPFSGGRDSSYGLHLIVNELKMKPIAYTYDWGMVTDLGRRNISRMCAQLGVENIIIAADIEKKRRNIKMNLEAWLRSPHLGLIALLTAGDKHFFRHLETVKKQTGISLNLWGVNPMEVTHFKAGFLGIRPDFEEDKVYANGWQKQLRYHKKRFQAMSTDRKYFNTSLIDTLSGEYYRSFMKKEDYFHLFDYWTWDENEVNRVLLNDYSWELANDTTTSWRIGDATAAFYNYVYYTVCGFTEHDTFRSNQIREGQISREEALKLIKIENEPRYNNLKWYLDSLQIDFGEAVRVINSIPKLY